MEVVLHEILGEIRGMKSDISDLKAGQVRLDSRLERVEEGQARLETWLAGIDGLLARLEARVESEITDKIRILFDAFRMHNERLDRHNKRLDRLR